MISADFWMRCAGLGLFLYGMYIIEDFLKQLEGRSFKLFLQKSTQNKFVAIISGTLVTAILQSSSIVNLMVLSLVGAGILSMQNALAVVLGANIGGTFNSWLIAFLGFKIDLNMITFPLIGMAGLLMTIFKRKKNIYKISGTLLGFGFLLLGLQFMKESMNGVLKHTDLSIYLHYNRIVFLAIGFIITAIIQTSSATVVLVLSALYAKLIPIDIAIAVVLGAELGTTIKLFIGSIGGTAAKKRVALGNNIFNFSTTFLGFIFLDPIATFIQIVIGIKDPIFLLVAFQTLINVVGVLTYYFFLHYFGKFLETRFKEINTSALNFLPHSVLEISTSALDMFNKEVGFFICRVININLSAFQIKSIEKIDAQFEQLLTIENQTIESFSHAEKYNRLKKAAGEIHAFYAKMLEKESNPTNIASINVLIESVRNAMYSAKCIKDIYSDLVELSNSINENKYNLYLQLTKELTGFYTALILIENNTKFNSQINNIRNQIKTDFDNKLQLFYSHASDKTFAAKDISTLFNINRELYASYKAIILALVDYKETSLNNKMLIK